MPNPADWFTKPTPHPAALRPPSPRKLALASLPLIVAKSASGFGRGEGICPLNGHGLPPLPIRIRSRMAVTWSGKLAKASSRERAGVRGPLPKHSAGFGMIEGAPPVPLPRKHVSESLPLWNVRKRMRTGEGTMLHPQAIVRASLPIGRRTG